MHWKSPSCPVHSRHEPLEGPWQELFAPFFLVKAPLLLLSTTLWQILWAVLPRQLRN